MLPSEKIIFESPPSFRAVYYSTRHFLFSSTLATKDLESDVIKLDILLNGDKGDALAYMAHRTVANLKGQQFTEALKGVIPRQQFDVAIQAAIGAKIISRQTVKAYRKDVTAKLYGGDVTRKMKLQKKQKEGKKRMKNIGRVEVPQDAFLSVLKVKD